MDMKQLSLKRTQTKNQGSQLLWMEGFRVKGRVMLWQYRK